MAHVTTARAEQARQVAQLRAEGLKFREIGERLGISLRRANEIYHDPDGSREYARKHKGKCQDCGRPTYTGMPSKGLPLRCTPCARAFQSTNAKWTRENIIDAIKRWHDLYGRAPAASDWNLASASVENRQRFRAGSYPHLNEVTRRFGQWSAAIRAAGFECHHRRAGEPRNVATPQENELLLRMKAADHSMPEIAKALGITPGAAYQRYLKLKGGNVPTSLKAGTVIERELSRCKDRQERATREAAEASEQMQRLETALAALSNGKPPAQS